MFRINNTRLLLTYPTHLNKDDYRRWTAETFPPTNFLELAHETGEDGYEHTHVLIRFTRMFQTTDARRFDFNEQHPNIQKVTTNIHWDNSIKYLAKQDVENRHLLQSINIVANMWEQPTIQDALTKHTKKWSDVTGILAAWNMKPREMKEPTQELNYPWQRELLEILDQPADLRTIRWYYDPVGGKGKSVLAIQLSRCSNDYIRISNMQGGLHNVATVVANAMSSGWTGRVVFFDIPRSSEYHKIYGTLEEIKNGHFSTTKYQGRIIDLDRSPHVVVLANFLPQVREMTLARWDIREILADYTTRSIEAVSLTLSETAEPGPTW